MTPQDRHCIPTIQLKNIVSQLAVHIVSMHRGMLLHANQERQLFISLRPEQLFSLTSVNATMKTYKRPNWANLIWFYARKKLAKEYN